MEIIVYLITGILISKGVQEIYKIYLNTTYKKELKYLYKNSRR